MSLPASRLLLSELTPRSLRVIEAEYHLELTARNTGEIVAQQAELLGLDSEILALTPSPTIAYASGPRG